MSVVDSAAGDLAAARKQVARRWIDSALVAGIIVALQLAWMGVIGYALYRLVV
jgi:hypothetical protein